MDAFDFVLAEALGQPLHVVRSWPNAEVVEWQAFMHWRNVVQEHESKKAGNG